MLAMMYLDSCIFGQNPFIMKSAFRFAYRLLLMCSFMLLIFNLPLKAANIDSLKTSLENQQGGERLSTMLLLGKAYQKTDRNESIIVFKDALLLIPENDLKQRADIVYKIAYNYFALKKNDSAVKYYGIALTNYENNKDTFNIIKTSYIKGLSLQRLGEFGKASDYYKAGIDLFAPYWENHEGEADIKKKHLAGMMTSYGNVLNYLGLYDSSLYYATKSYKIHIEIGSSSKLVANALISIGNAYMVVFQNEEAINYYVDAMEIYIPLGDSVNIGKCYNNIGMANKRMGNKAEAIKYYEKSLEISRATKSKRGTATSLINLSGLYSEKGEKKKAEDYLLEGLKMGKEIGDKKITSTAYGNLATLSVELDKLDKALSYAHKANKVIKETEDMQLLQSNSLSLSEIYEKKGNYDLALKYHKQYKTVYDSLFNADNTERFNRLQTEFETSKKEQEIVLLTKDKENQLLENRILKNRQTTYIIVIVLILFLAIIIGYMIFLKRKKDQQIHRQKEIVHRKEKELAKSELEKSRLKEEELQQSVIYKSKQLSTHALHMMQKNTMLQEIQKSIKNLAKDAHIDDKPNYKRISLQLKQSLQSDKDWVVFKLYFEDVNRDFYKNLNKINPELSKNDYRTCALIKLNMSSKQMASVLNVALNSVKSSRYRLKKKLGLDVDADLEEFIRGLG